MEKVLNSPETEMKADNLIYDLKHPLEVAMVAMDVTGIDELHRGSLLGKNAAGKYAILGTEGYTADCIRRLPINK